MLCYMEVSQLKKAMKSDGKKIGARMIRWIRSIRPDDKISVIDL